MAKTVILGGGESGFGAAVLAKQKGHDVFLSDSGIIREDYKEGLRRWDIPFEECGHTNDLLTSAELVVKSPGIPDSAPLIRLLCSYDIPVISEIEFAGRYIGDSKTICVTGSNGKTTTATLIYRTLRDAGYDCALAGNVGDSLAYRVATAPAQWYVLELSSFQLDGMSQFKAHIAVLLNITADHLDRYEYDFHKYIASKMRIVQNQTNDDWFIFLRDDENIRTGLWHTELPMRILPFSLLNKSEQSHIEGHDHARWQGAHPETEGIYVAEVEGGRFAFGGDELKIKGRHNLCNAMAATLAAMAAGVPHESLRRTLTSFEGIEHRLEAAGEIDGVKFINDSKATNTDAAWYALESMTSPVVWIAGGTDKGNDYDSLCEIAGRKVKALICMGVDNCKLIDKFTGTISTIADTASLDQAMQCALAEAEPGDTVLLSPACASFDLFENYEDRGRQFKKWVADHAK